MTSSVLVSCSLINPRYDVNVINQVTLSSLRTWVHSRHLLHSLQSLDLCKILVSTVLNDYLIYTLYSPLILITFQKTHGITPSHSTSIPSNPFSVQNVRLVLKPKNTQFKVYVYFVNHLYRSSINSYLNSSDKSRLL